MKMQSIKKATIMDMVMDKIMDMDITTDYYKNYITLVKDTS